MLAHLLAMCLVCIDIIVLSDRAEQGLMVSV